MAGAFGASAILSCYLPNTCLPEPEPESNKMAKLKSLLTDLVSLNEGTWVEVNPSMYDDLRIKTRGFTDKFYDAQTARLRKARIERNLGPDEPLPNNIQRDINSRLAQEFLVLEVSGLEHDDGSPVPIDEFKQLMSHENAGRLVRAVFEAAARVSSRTEEIAAADVGNSLALSQST